MMKIDIILAIIIKNDFFVKEDTGRSLVSMLCFRMLVLAAETAIPAIKKNQSPLAPICRLKSVKLCIRSENMAVIHSIYR